MDQGIVERYIESSLRKYARSAHADLRDDLRQECHRAVLEAAAKLDPLPAADLGPAVEKISRNKIQNTFRAQRRLNGVEGISLESRQERGFDAAAPEPIDLGASPEELNEALEKLPEIERYVLRAAFWENATEEQLALVLGRSRWAVRQLKETAIKKLKTLLS